MMLTSTLLFIFFNLVAGVDVRLTNGTHSHEGRVEVYSKGQWHNVCGYNWGLNTADVICRELGYAFALHPSDTDNYGEGSTNVYSIPVVCQGTEKTLDECVFKYDEFCPHSRDIGVVCSNKPLRTGSVRLSGTLSYESYHCGEVLVFLDNTWGGICDKRDTWNDVSAKISCKQMGFDGLIDTSYKYYYERERVIGSIYCTGKESELLECQYDQDTSGCNHQSKFKIGVTVCCYYSMFTWWFCTKLITLLAVVTFISVCVCAKMCASMKLEDTKSTGSVVPVIQARSVTATVYSVFELTSTWINRPNDTIQYTEIKRRQMYVHSPT